MRRSTRPRSASAATSSRSLMARWIASLRSQWTESAGGDRADAGGSLYSGLASVHAYSARHVDPLTRHEAGGVGGEEQDDVGDVLGLLDTAHRRQRDIFGANGFRRHPAQLALPDDLAFLHRGPHEAWANRVHPDSMRRHFARQRLGPAQHRELARRIMREQRRANLPGERGRVDVRAGARVAEEIPAGDLIAEKY